MYNLKSYTEGTQETLNFTNPEMNSHILKATIIWAAQSGTSAEVINRRT